MRRIATASALALALLAAPAAAHPGHGPLTISVLDDIFTPGGLEISTGDTVIWSWDGTAGNHTVSADPGQRDSFESDPGVAAGSVAHPVGFTFSHQFNTTGTFTYSCRVHGFRGVIVVSDALGAPPPADNVAPRLTSVRVTGRRLRFSLSEAATVTVDIVGARRASARREVLRSLDLDGVKGVNRATLRTLGLRAGTYRLSLTAIDPAGNTSRRKRVSMKVARR